MREYFLLPKNHIHSLTVSPQLEYIYYYHIVLCTGHVINSSSDKSPFTHIYGWQEAPRGTIYVSYLLRLIINSLSYSDRTISHRMAAPTTTS